MPLAALDFETSSPDPLTTRIVTGCVLRVDGSEVRARNWLANPGVEIPAEATAVHGYTTEYAEKYGRPHDEVAAEVVAEVRQVFAEGRALVIFNASFDATILAANDPSFTSAEGLIVDPYVIDKRCDRYRRGSRKLSAVCIHYGIRLDDAHDAEADALAAARLAYILPRRYPELAAMTATELMSAQVNWHTEQTASFAAYLEKQGKPVDDLRYGWPITQQRAEVTA
ncbi:3'-5' exonuclease [Nocardia higoensis]|uniref:3'-5' exonuclease n=2 Tax=Nocardia higoensis TaxID=228599 RepID=A0ABS0DI04_9NOCA|nr:3'-5' exonuclease [Nocardia higoensis]